MKRHIRAALISLSAISVWCWGASAGELKSFQRGSWQEIRSAHVGQPVIVHFWGLTCGPCRIEMPQWGKFAASKSVVPLITIHADPLPNNIALVHDMLAAAGLRDVENWVFDDSFKERLRHEIDSKWRGELPRTMLIGRDGSITVLTGSAEMAVVDDWIAEQGKASQ